MRLGIVFVPLLAVVLTACGSVGLPALPSDRETLVLRAKSFVGMPGPKPAELPEFSLFGGGRLLVPGDREGALQVVREKHLDDRTAKKVYRSAYQDDLDRDEYVDNNVMDGYLLVFTLYGGEGKLHRVRAATPSTESGGRLGELADFQDELGEVAKYAELAPEPYRPERLVAVGWAPSESPESTDVRPWPFAALSEPPRVDGGPCLLMEGEAARQAEAVGRSATPATRWRTAGTTWLVVFRPLLPDERSCADLVAPE